MSTAEKRVHAHKLIDRMDDEFFDALYGLMETYMRKQENAILGYTVMGEPVRVGDFLKQAEEAVRRAKAGEGVTVDEMKKRSEEWLANTK